MLFAVIAGFERTEPRLVDHRHAAWILRLGGGLASKEILGDIVPPHDSPALLSFSIYNACMNDEGDSQPNILLITASNSITPIGDDEFDGGLSELRSRGMAFTQAYSAAPHEHGAWIALVTGQYPQRWGVFAEDDGIYINPERTISEVLGEVGYSISSVFEPQYAPTPYFCHLTVSEESADAEVAQILRDLDDADTGDTVVIYTSMNVESEQNLKVPFIMVWPGVIEPHSTSDALVSHLDVFSTVADLAGIDVSPAGLSADGLTLLPTVIHGEKAHQTLFHSTGNAWSARTSDFILRGPSPLHLMTPDKEEDVSADYPHVSDTLIEQYVRWKDFMTHGPLT